MRDGQFGIRLLRRGRRNALVPVRKHLIWLLVLVAYVYPFPYFQRLNNPNENVRVWMTRALVDYHEIDLTRVTRDWGFVDDKATTRDGRLVSSKAPGTSFLGVPVYGVLSAARHVLGLGPPSPMTATWALRVFTVALPMSAFLLFFARWAEAITQSAVARDLLMLGLGLGTPFYPYSLLFVGHAQGAALAFVAFAWLGAVPRGAPMSEVRKRLASAGFVAGLAVVFEYQLALVEALLAVWVLARHKARGGAFLLGLVPGAALLAVYHTWLFGRPWTIPYGHLENPIFASTHHARGFLGLGAPSIGAFASLCLSPDVGLFAFSPFLLVGVAGAAVAIRKGPRGEGAVALAIAAAMLLTQAGMSNWRAGWSVGPRYSVVVAPLLAGSAAWVWKALPIAAAVPLVGGLVGASVLNCTVSGAVFPHYPPAFDNPVFELALPLLQAGHAPYNAGRLAGLRGAWSLLPLGLCIVAAWTIAVTGCGRRTKETGPLRALSAAILAAAVVAAFSLSGRAAEPEEEDARRMVEAIWEPVR